MIDLDKLEEKLDEALEEETPESLRNWIKQKRKQEEGQEDRLKQVTALTRFLAEGFMEWHRLRLKALSKDPEDCWKMLAMEFPSIEKSSQQKLVTAIGDEDYDIDDVTKAVMYLNGIEE